MAQLPCNPSGITDGKTEVIFSAFPNPSTGFFQIDAQFFYKTDKVTLLISDLTGREVLRYEENIFNNKLNKSINLSDLDKGFYFLTLGMQKKKVMISY